MPSPPGATTHDPANRTEATTQGNPGRSLQTYDAVMRILSIPGVLQVTMRRPTFAFADVERDTYNRAFLWAEGDTAEETIAKLEQAVRDAYMAVS